MFCSFRAGSYFPQISIACYDVYGNRTLFSRFPKVRAKVPTSQDVLFQAEMLKPHLLTFSSHCRGNIISQILSLSTFGVGFNVEELLSTSLFQHLARVKEILDIDGLD